MQGHLVRMKLETAQDGLVAVARRVDQLIKEFTPNELHRYEVDRYFRHFVDGFSPSTIHMGGDLFFRGAHVHDLTNGLFRRLNYNGEFTSAATLAAGTETMRYRYRASKTSLAPASPNQIGYAMGRIFTTHGSGFVNPNGMMSEVDINLRQIGGVFGHPVGRRAFFNETLQPTVGTGTMNPFGPLTFSPGDEGHYIYDVRIAKTGTESTAQYVFRRRPFFEGCYEAGAGQSDFIVSAGGDTPQTRVAGDRVYLDIAGIIPNTPAPNPATVPYTVNYPTSTAVSNNLSSACPGLAFDGLLGGRMWWATLDYLASSNVNASSSRALWTWKRFSPEAPRRMDTVLTGFPALATGTQFRDVRNGRGGLIYVAVDANDNANTGSNSGGALIIIDAATDTVIQVIGAAAGGIYTLGGFFQDNVLGIAVDTSETRAAAGSDRVWVLHRNGLSFFDINTTSHAVGARSTVSNAGATFNALTAGSIRGLGGYSFQGANGAVLNNHQPYLDWDTNGDVYWISAPGTTGIQRLNKLIGDASAATFYSLDTGAEGGALGFIDIGEGDAGLGAATRRQVSGMRVHRRDPQDPLPDDLWISAGKGQTASLALVRQIPVDAFVAGNNPGFGYPGADFLTDGTVQQFLMVVTKCGSVWVGSSFNQKMALLESLGRKTQASVAGATKTIAFVAGSTYSLTDTTASFPTDVVGRPLFIASATNAGNNGRWLITARISATVIQFTDAGGVAEGPTDLAWAIDYFDSDGGAGQGTQTNNGLYASMLSQTYVDDSGMGYFFQPRSSGTITQHAIHFHIPMSFQYATGFLTIDTSGGASASRGPANNQVTLTADTFTGGVRAGDYFRVTSGPFTGTQIQILSFDSATQITLVADAPAFGPETWTVRRQDWYCSRFSTLAVAAQKVASTTAEALVMGARVNFANGVGPSQFIIGEYYTFGATIGILKDSTQQVTFSYDLYNEKTDLTTADATTLKTAVDGTAKGGYIPSANQVAVLTDDPFTGAGRPGAGAQLQLGHYQRRLILDGTSGSQNTTQTSTYSTTTGFQCAIDLGSDQIASVLRFSINTNAFNTVLIRELVIDLYSATAGAGSASWTLRGTYRSDLDEPSWNLAFDPLHDSTSVGFINSGTSEFEVDLNALLGVGNTARRYWKMYIHTSTTSAGAVSTAMVGVAALDGSGIPIGMPLDKYLSASIDSNYLANYIVRTVFIQDQGVGTTSSRSASNPKVITLSGDTFNTVAPTDVASNDFFRLTRSDAGGATKSIAAANPLTGLALLTDSAGGFSTVYAGGSIRVSGASVANNGLWPVVSVVDSQNIYIANPNAFAEGPINFAWALQSVDMKIFSRDSTTQITLYGNAPAYYASENWEVVRPADVRPRDDEGGSENLARFPNAAGEIFLCPVTGGIFYHATDVSNARVTRWERYVKVKRSL